MNNLLPVQIWIVERPIALYENISQDILQDAGSSLLPDEDKLLEWLKVNFKFKD